MAITSTASTSWKGGLADGSGHTSLGSGVASFNVDWKARSEGSDSTTTPEELLAAAHASCYSMALSHELGQHGTPPESVHVTAAVEFQPGEGVLRSVLTVEATVPGLDQELFGRFAEDAKTNCPVSKALAGIELVLASATLS